DPVQSLEVALDLAAAEPPRHQRGDLVTERVAQEGGVARARADLVADQRLDVGSAGRTVDDITDILLGTEPDHDPQTVPRGDVQERAGRSGVGDPDGVDPVCRHQREVPLHGGEIMVLVSRRVWSERPVRHTPHVQLLVADKEELAAHTWPDSRGRCWGGLKCRRGWLHVAAQTRRRSHDQPAVVTLAGRPFGGALYDAPHGTPRACEGASDDPSWPQTRKRHAVCRRASRTARTARRKDGKPCND